MIELRSLWRAAPNVVTVLGALVPFGFAEDYLGVVLEHGEAGVLGSALALSCLAVSAVSLWFIWRGPAPDDTTYQLLVLAITIISGLRAIGPVMVGSFGWDNVAAAVFFAAMLACAVRTVRDGRALVS